MDPPVAIEPDDPLAQPTRARLFALLGELKRAAGTRELARRLELHPNGVRVHLERLEEAGLVLRSRARQPRGRPRDAWIIAPGARPGGAAPRGYADLGRWLVRALPSRPGEAPDARAVGLAIGRDIAPRDADADPDPLRSTLSALGFNPDAAGKGDGETDGDRDGGDRDGRREYLLLNCPYRDAARQNPGLVCGLHRGITQGLIEVLAPGSELAAFIPRDPDVAGCRIEIAAPRGCGRG